MRISDWSSDVCSSDLVERDARAFDHDLEVEALRVAEVVGLDPRLVGRAAAGERDPAAAARVQVEGVQGVAVAGQAVAAMVVDHRGDEMQLDVGTNVGGER